MRLTDNEFYTKEDKEKACHIQESRLQAIYDKLFELEDIEEELGIDLITLFKLFKSKKVFSFSNCGIWQTDNNGINLYSKTISIWNGICKNEYPLSDYGKSFALTKEELL